MRKIIFLQTKRAILVILLSMLLVLGWRGAARAVYIQGACLGTDDSFNQYCKTGLNGKNCVDDPKCYWEQCEAKNAADQKECNDRFAIDPGSCERDRSTDRKDCKCIGVTLENNGKTRTETPCTPEPEIKTPAFSTITIGEETKPCGPGGKYQCIELKDPLGGKASEVPEMLGLVIKAALGLVGSLTLLMLVWGGFTWLTSAGNAERVKKGTDTMLWAIIGVLLVFASYLIVSTFTNYLTGAQ